jgi:DNA-binding transcriptional ArsR family regulator
MDIMINEPERIEKHYLKIASLIGEHSRAAILWNLLDGRAYTLTELAICADISKQACSNHILKLVEAKLLSVEKQGRYKYYRFSNDKVAQVIENIAYLMPSQVDLNHPINLKPNGIKYARKCYDHLAGWVGVEITNAMLSKGIILYNIDRYFTTDFGEKWFTEIGINIPEIRQMKRKFAYPCLDWSERKHHIGGALGASFLNVLFKNDWVRKIEHSREIIITGKGKAKFNSALKIGI